MLNRFAPLVPLALVTLLFGCAAHSPVSQQQEQQSIAAHHGSVKSSGTSSVFDEELATEEELSEFGSSKPYQLPALADNILERGMSLIGTRYRSAVLPRPRASIAAVSSVICFVKKLA